MPQRLGLLGTTQIQAQHSSPDETVLGYLDATSLSGASTLYPGLDQLDSTLLLDGLLVAIDPPNKYHHDEIKCLDFVHG